jgi:hypothetical protein
MTCQQKGQAGAPYVGADVASGHLGSLRPLRSRVNPVREFRRLKDDERRRLSLAWNLNRKFSKFNYRIHTDAIKEQAPHGRISISPSCYGARFALLKQHTSDVLLEVISTA